MYAKNNVINISLHRDSMKSRNVLSTVSCNSQKVSKGRHESNSKENINDYSTPLSISLPCDLRVSFKIARVLSKPQLTS